MRTSLAVRRSASASTFAATRSGTTITPSASASTKSPGLTFTRADVAPGNSTGTCHAVTFQRPIVTRVDPLKGFYPAEAYHQDFLAHNPTYPYIVINDLPKIANLKRLFPDQHREKPVLTAAAS